MDGKKEILVRMFFKDGHVETRPLSWLFLTTSEDFLGKEHLDKFIEGRVEGEDSELYIAFVDQMNGMQIYRGEFVNVRAEQRKGNFSKRR